MKREKMQIDAILKKLRALSNPRAVEGMARFGINPENTFGVSIPNLRRMAKEIGKDHSLAQQLWFSGIHEARILASMIDDPNQVTGKQMDLWIKDFNSWDVCDQCCMNLFSKTSMAWEKAIEWTKREKEFEKRAGFVLMACLAWYDKESSDNKFLVFLPVIKQEANDNRNYVKKAVNWALRNIGKRNPTLNKKAIETAKEIQKMDSRSAKWIASDAIRELTSEAVQERLQKETNKEYVGVRRYKGGRINMSEKNNNLIAYCGLYCGDCPIHKGKIADLSRDLRKELREVRFDKTAEALSEISFFKAFNNYQQCYEVLGEMVKLRCGKVCKDGGGPPFCKIRKCCQKRDIAGCWECKEFETCEKLDFLKPGHGDAHLKNLRKINKQGIEEFLKGEKCWYVKPK